MSNVSEDLAQLIEITGLDPAAAESLLDFNNHNLEQAINYHLEANAGGNSETNISASSSSASSSVASSSSSQQQQPQQQQTSNVKDDTTTDTVRAPIPAKREQLVMPEDDNFRFRKRRAPAFSICPLRNFAREAEIQEEQLNAYLDGASGGCGGVSAGAPSAGGGGGGGSGGGNGSNNQVTVSTVSRIFANARNRAAENNATNSTGNRNTGTRRPLVKMTNNIMTKLARLEDLFRPPIDLLYWGTFHAARDYATMRNRWLLVNLQDNAEFKSQIINRDIWSDQILRDLIQKYFILWQVSVDIPEGFRFKTFYKVETMPYICVIDPRTGEEKRAFDVVTAQTFLADLSEYLQQVSYSLEENNSKPTTSRQSESYRSLPTTSAIIRDSSQSRFISSRAAATIDSEKLTDRRSSLSAAAAAAAAATTTITTTTAASSTQSVTITSLKTDELSEEDQLALAIKNSLEETHQDQLIENNDDDTKKDFITLTDSDEEASTYEQYLGNENEPITTIQLRLPNGKRAQLEWPSTTKLRAIKLYVRTTYPNETKEPYKVISAFSRQNILELDQNSNLIDAELHPRAVLHLHPDN